jgi:hypothetical protein
MKNLITPPAFTEKFTLYLNDANQPVQRTLREMTAGEVMLAISWAEREANELEAQTAQWMPREGETQGQCFERIRSEGDVKAAAALLRKAGEAREHEGRLLLLIFAQMPQWRRRGTSVTFGAALRRWWPGGR